ncbi:MAG: AraC family transcriptional regulator [Venatoribacter sp.]
MIHQNHQQTNVANSQQTVSALWLRGLVQAAEGLGIDAKILLSNIGVKAEVFQTPYARIPLGTNLSLWREIERLSPVEHTGLRIGEMVKPSHFQLLALTLMHSPNIGAAFTKSLRYTRLLSDGGQYYLECQGDQAALYYEPVRNDFSYHQVDAVMVLLQSFALWLACRPFPLLGVELKHAAPVDMSDYQRIFSAPVKFSAPRNALIFSADLLAEPLSLGDEYLAQLHEQMLEAQLSLLQQPDTVSLVRHYLLSTENLTIDRSQMAERLHMSGRTLQRKLQESGTSFQTLLDEERNQRAQQLLKQSQYSLTEISALLGFAESSVFSRAFKRWNAVSPQEFRRHKLNG